MNPPKAQTTTNAGSVNISVGGSGSTFHQHPFSLLTGMIGEGQLPERLMSNTPWMPNCDDAIETGFWCADGFTANTPFNPSSWVGLTVHYGLEDAALFGVQFIAEVLNAGPRPVYYRTQQFNAWSDWQRLDGPETTTLAGVAPFAGTVTLRRIGKMVYADGAVSRAAGSSTSYTTCADAIPADFLPAADTPLVGSLVFNTAVSYQFQATAAGALQVRMSGADASDLVVNGHWAV